MNCRELRPFWPMFLDGELAPSDSQPYLEHLEACEGCRGFIDGERRFRVVLRSKLIGRDRAPEALRARVVARPGSEERRPAWRWVTASATLGLLLAFTWTTQSGFAPVLENVAEKHRQALPMDVSTQDADEAQRFVQRHVPRVRLPAFQASMVQLAGARVVDLPGQRRAVFARYVVGREGRLVSLAVYRDEQGGELALPRAVTAGRQRVYVDRVGNLQAAVWQAQDLVYSMVGDVDEREILEIVSAASTP